MTAPDGECLNCGAILVGTFCHRCGQRSEPRVLPVRALLAGAADDLLSWDARIVRTLRMLLLRPGSLTREYLAGRRVDYLAPFRLYLLASAMNLALAAALHSRTFFFFSAAPGAGNERMLSYFPRVMFVLLPAFAAVLALVYGAARRLFAEHFVFALHFHAAAFCLATLHILLTTPGSWAPPGARVLDGVVQLAVPVHLYLSLRTVYGRSRLATAVSMVALLAGYSLILFAAVWAVAEAMVRSAS